MRKLLESKRGRLLRLGLIDCELSGAELLGGTDSSADCENNAVVQFSGLEWLDISGNRFRSAITPLLRNCAQLKVLRLNRNAFPVSPEALRPLTGLRELYMDESLIGKDTDEL